ncbi:MAG: ABC transporter ATP-binding protein [Treponema sp.]
MCFLDVQNITKNWQTKTISVSFSLAEGSSLALLGDSGSGKTTILKMIAGLVKIDSGALLLNGKDITNTPCGKRDVGMVFQDYALFPHFTVEDNVAYGLFCNGMSKKYAREEVAKWIKLFELERIKKLYPNEISGGEKQRVSLARSLAIGNHLILFDEPLSALDSKLRKKLQSELKEHQKSLGYTAIYVTHDESEAEVLAEKIIYMN